MDKAGTKILHWLVLFITGAALIGVNVQQLYCVHSDQTHWEVSFLPADPACPCDYTCCCCTEDKEGHAPERHDFYKVTDFSTTEQGVQIILSPLYLPGTCLRVSADIREIPENKLLPERYEASPLTPSGELLCTFRC